VTKDGTTQLGGQRFRCSQCGRRFTRRSSSAFSDRSFPDDIIALAEPGGHLEHMRDLVHDRPR